MSKSKFKKDIICMLMIAYGMVFKVSEKGNAIGQVNGHHRGFYDRTTYLFQELQAKPGYGLTPRNDSLTVWHFATNRRVTLDSLGEMHAAKFSPDWSSLHFFRFNDSLGMMEYCRLEVPDEKVEKKKSPSSLPW